MSKVRHHSRRLQHGGGSPGRAAPEVSVDTADQENQWRRKCHFDYKRRQIKESSDRTKEHQRERVLLPPTEESSKEGVHIDGSTSLRDGRTTPTEQRGPRSLPDEKVEHRKQQAEPTNMVKIVLVGNNTPSDLPEGTGASV